MANALGTTQVNVIMQQALALLQTARPQLASFSTDFSDERCMFGASILTRTFTAPTVNDFGTGATDRADADVAIVLNQHKEIHHKITYAQLIASMRDLGAESGKIIAAKIGNAIIDAASAVWTVGNFNNTATSVATASVGNSTMTALRKALVGRGVEGTRSVALHQDAYEKLLNDSLAIGAYKDLGGGNDPTVTGVMRGIAGFDYIFEYPAFFTGNSTTSTNPTGFAFGKEAVLIASRPPKDPTETMGGVPYAGKIEYVTDPKTGFTVQYEIWIDQATLDVNLRAHWMIGVKASRAATGQFLLVP